MRTDWAFWINPSSQRDCRFPQELATALAVTTWPQFHPAKTHTMKYPTFAESLELASFLYGIDADELLNAMAADAGSRPFQDDDTDDAAIAYGFACSGRLSDMSLFDTDQSFGDATCVPSAPEASSLFDWSTADLFS